MIASRFFHCPVSNLGIQVFRHSRAIAYPEHSHSEMAIVICTRGILESTQFACRELLHEGQVLFTNASVPHASRYCVNGQPTHGVALEFDSDVLRRLGYDGSSLYLRSCFLGKLNMPEVTKLARMIEDESLKQDKESLLMVTALARQIVVLALREWPKVLIRSHASSPLSLLPRNELVRSIEIMNNTVARDFAVPRLARQLHRSTSVFSRLFVRSVGDSPHSYYRTLLLQKAADLLANTDRPIKDIALTLGFNSVSHFSNSFRLKWSLPPTDFRQQKINQTYILDRDGTFYLR